MKSEGEEATKLYCKNCGGKINEGAAYCKYCGTPVLPPPPGRAVVGPQATVVFSGWTERFIAWLIDIIIIGFILAPTKLLLPPAIWPGFTWVPSFLRVFPLSSFGLDNVIYFLYWTFMEGTYGQSIGKMVLRLKVTQLNGDRTDIAHAAVESLGKAFLLPIDCILGWILYPGKGQRLFNYISQTIVVSKSS